MKYNDHKSLKFQKGDADDYISKTRAKKRKERELHKQKIAKINSLIGKYVHLSGYPSEYLFYITKVRERKIDSYWGDEVEYIYTGVLSHGKHIMFKKGAILQVYTKKEMLLLRIQQQKIKL